MVRTRKLAGAALAAALVVGGLTAGSAAASATESTCGAGDSVTTVTGTLNDGALYELQCPPDWNGTLFLYSHGYVVPGSSNPAQDVGDPATGTWLLTHGYALEGSSYASTGWAIAQALPDQVATLRKFAKLVGAPKRTIAWGHSLGGIITAGLIQTYPRRFNAALPMCGVLSGGVATWNTALDGAFAFQQLADPSVQVVGIKNPLANLANARQVLATAQGTPQGRARIALGAALGDTPGWYASLSPEPAANDYATQEANQFEWDSNVDFPFVFAFRAELELRAHGNPSWNTGVNYARQLAKSADLREVKALYKAAHLSLHADLATLDHAPRIGPDPTAVAYLAKNISFTGKLSAPVLTMHTIGDGLVIPQNERAYAQVVRRAGDASLLRQVFVSRAGHCAFTPAETITAVQALLHRLNTGSWADHALTPKAMNKAAAALGPDYNIFLSGHTIVPVGPAFRRFKPSRYPRPFSLSAP